MVKYISAILVSLAVSLGFSQVASAAEETAQTGKVIVYRASEGSKTKKVRFNVNIDDSIMGRLKSNRTLVTSVEAGEYELGSSLSGGENLSISVKPGQTVYVYTKVKRLGDKVTPEFVLVEEQVAVAQQPAIESII